MSRFARLLRVIFVWWLPALALMLTLVLALAFWLVASERGTRFLLTTIAAQFDGEAEQVRGTLLKGVRADRFALSLPGVEVSVTDLDLAVDWLALQQRLVHVNNLSASRLDVALTSQPEQAPADPSEPVDINLPVRIAVDRLALDEFTLTQDGEPLPIELSGLQGTLAAGPTGAQVRVNALRVGHEIAQTDIEAEVVLDRLADPWPLKASIVAAANAQPPDSPLCLDRVWAATQAAPSEKPASNPPAKAGAQAAKRSAGKLAPTSKIEKAAPTPTAEIPATTPRAEQAAVCTLVVSIQAEGSLEAMKVIARADGSGVALDAVVDLTPRGLFPLRTARADLSLPDGSGLNADVKWESESVEGAVRDQLSGKLSVRRLDVGRLVGDAIPPALLTLGANFDVSLRNHQVLERSAIDLVIDPASRWNRQPLKGHVRGQVVADPGADAMTDPLAALRVDGLDIDLQVAENRLRAAGNLGQSASAITLDLAAPWLAALWPDVPGAASLKGKIGGTVAAHQGDLAASYTPARSRPGQLGLVPADASLRLKGGWGPGRGDDAVAKLVGWRGTLDALKASHAGFGVNLAREVAISFLPQAVAPQWQWQVGAANVAVALPNRQSMALNHLGSRGGAGRWETAGRIDNAAINRELVRGIMGAIDPEALKRDDREQGHVNKFAPGAARQIALDASWDLKFAGALSGQARVARRSGDLLIPGDPPVPLELRDLAIYLTARPTSGAGSRLDARLNAVTARAGTINGSAQVMLLGLGLAPNQPIQARVNADIADLGWVGLFTGDAVDIGGAVNASIEATGVPGKDWKTSGTVRAKGLKIVQIDNGIRLFDGTLSARLADNNVVLESLRFPASLRVLPTEWRTRTWITEEADAKNGYIEARGQWSLLDSTGSIGVNVHRFPILQRSDRFAMITGNVDIDAALPRLTITGDLKADAGWVSLEILQSVPTLDDDVRVRKPGDKDTVNVPMQARMNLKFDMGPRFYISGMGLNSGIVGNIQILLNAGRLSGAGQLRTRGGRIEAYGQGLQLRRGTVTFQGAIDNPVLDIEALRVNQQVQAGVKVGGTAQRPRINLVSYPDVTDVEKLSWLILGRGPDDGGGEAALLLSAGASFLTGDEPFYRKFGLDDVSVRSGAIGSSGSILPDRTVVSSVNRASDDLATQFVVASKRFANGITLSLEQSMSGSGTVGRVSYQLARGLSADLKGGTVTGLSLVYRTFFQ